MSEVIRTDNYINFQFNVLKYMAEKQYLLGRRDEEGGCALYIGRYLALDGSTGSSVLLDVKKPHAVVICGKRGYGKSYTMGVLIEEFSTLPETVRNNFAVVLIDTMGIFSDMVHPAHGDLSQWGLTPAGVRIRQFAPRAFLEGLPPGTLPFEIPTGSLSVYDYCELLGIEPLSAHGAAMIGAACRCGSFSIDSLSAEIARSDAPDEVRLSLCGLLSMISRWGLFSSDADFKILLQPGSINVIDLSGYGHDPGIKSCAVASLARALYDIRVRARRREHSSRDSPLIWLMIDEAHMFINDRGPGATAVLVNEWLRQGRQPGLSLVLATQRPAALGSDVLSQADVIVCHRLTLRDDVEAMEQARPLYVKQSIKEALSRLGSDRGAALVLDDATESFHVIRVRPRFSRHGGGEPDIYES